MSRPSTLLTVKRRGGLIKGGTSRRSGCVYAPTSAGGSLVQHANARLTVHARRLLVERVEAGWPQARVAEQLGVARQTGEHVVAALPGRWRRSAARPTEHTGPLPGPHPGDGRAAGDRGAAPAPGGANRALGDARRSRVDDRADPAPTRAAVAARARPGHRRASPIPGQRPPLRASGAG